MCGRFTLTSSPEEVARRFGLDAVPELAPRFNVAPSQAVAAVRRGPDGRRDLSLLRWGLVPAWARDVRIGERLINARAETLAEKPAFRDAFRSRRCLVPADGFYEWGAGPGVRQPYHVAFDDGAPFGIAGLWERWRSPGGERVESCTLVTTDANDVLRPIHDRMPVILDPSDHARWLDPESDPAALRALLRPAPSERLAIVPVSPRVNDPRCDDPGCLARHEPQPRLL